jgi:hypothetical protein
MAVLIVPDLDDEPWPTLGAQVCDFIEDRAVFGPGSLKGVPAVLDREKRAAIYRAYEVYPKEHPLAGRRRFKRVGLSWRKGTAKTEWAAWLAYAELHPEAPVRCDGFDADGDPVGRPVRDPYIPLLAYTEEQTEDLAYAALYVVVTEGPDADLFDAGLDRIVRLDDNGKPDGKATALAGSPNARDGARTTFQHFDEPHRMVLPKLLQAHETMSANLPKRPLEDPWSLYTTTAGVLDEGSVAEQIHGEAQQIAKGEIEDPELFYLHRQAGPGHDLSKFDDRLKAIEEATGPVGEYGPGQFRDIAKQWDRPGADLRYLERVWLNRWLPSVGGTPLSLAWSSRRVDAPNGNPQAFGLDATWDREWFTLGWSLPGSVDVHEHKRGSGWVVEECQKLQAKYPKVPVWVWPKGPAGNLIDDLRKGDVLVRELDSPDLPRACGDLYDDVIEGRLGHSSHPALDAAVAGACTSGGASWVWDRKHGAVISPLYAVTLARWGAAQKAGKGRVLVL